MCFRWASSTLQPDSSGNMLIDTVFQARSQTKPVPQGTNVEQHSGADGNTRTTAFYRNDQLFSQSRKNLPMRGELPSTNPAPLKRLFALEAPNTLTLAMRFETSSRPISYSTYPT